MSYDIYTCSVSPCTELFYSTGSECISCSNHGLSSVTLIKSCKLSNRCCLSYTVYTDDKYNAVCILITICRIIKYNLITKDVLYKFLTLLSILYSKFLDTLSQVIDNLFSRLKTHIRLNKSLLEIVVKIIIYFSSFAEYVRKVLAGLLKTFF